MISRVIELPIESKWEVLALISMWQVARQANPSITFSQVAKHYNPQFTSLQIDEPEEWVRAISNSL